VALLVAAAGVSNTVLMAVTERTREIGVMRALGAARSDVFRLFWGETLLICAVGCATGLAAAMIASRSLELWLRTRLPFAPAETLLRWEWSVVVVCIGGALLLGGLAGFLPSWKAAQLSPMVAMRSGGTFMAVRSGAGTMNRKRPVGGPGLQVAGRVPSRGGSGNGAR
jgi:putative ABC transport system permease protein